MTPKIKYMCCVSMKASVPISQTIPMKEARHPVCDLVWNKLTSYMSRDK